MNRIRHVAVVIPARDEADTIEATIDAVDRARTHLPAGVSSSCVVVVDASSDATGALIERRTRVASDGRRSTSSIVVRTAHGCVGAARSVGCRVALAGSLHRPRHVWLANTDADTVVPVDWLAAQLELAERDVTAIAGAVELGVDVDDTLRANFDATYELSPDGTHRHVHGANLGTRGDVYLLAGGWRRLHTGEDHDLWARLGQVTKCVSSTAITVRTSARLLGRAPAGFARDIARIVAAGESPIALAAALEPTVA
ncbi:MAG TPA: glycosyltransferase family 2 protein [Ilumatobacteraceae bacterium]|nr:glycosyltransferase family 2 protein [Ilumatobacteraceae bacterium]